MSVDGGVLRKDCVGNDFLSTVFLCVPAKEVIAAACRGRQTFQLPVFGGGAGRVHAAAVGVKGHRVLLRRLLLPMSIDDRVLRKDCVGRYFLSTSFFRVPAEEVITAVCRGRQTFQLPVFGLGAGWAYATTVCVKGYCIFLSNRFFYYLNGNVRFHGVVVVCVIRCEDCRIGLCSFGLWNGASVFPCPAFRQGHVGKRFSHLCGNAGRHRIGRSCFCNRQVKGALGVVFFSNRAQMKSADLDGIIAGIRRQTCNIGAVLFSLRLIPIIEFLYVCCSAQAEASVFFDRSSVVDRIV